MERIKPRCLTLKSKMELHYDSHFIASPIENITEKKKPQELFQ
jgi:hypothetical protein